MEFSKRVLIIDNERRVIGVLLEFFARSECRQMQATGDAHAGRRPRRARAITSQAYGRETLCRVERFRVRLTPTRR